MHLSVTVKEIQARYISISYFKGIYLYLAQNNMPKSKAVIRKVEVLVEKIYTIRLIIIQSSIFPRGCLGCQSGVALLVGGYVATLWWFICL